MMECWCADSRNRPTFANLERDLQQLIENLEQRPDPNQPVASEIYVPASQHYLEPVPSSASPSSAAAPRLQRMMSNDSGVASGLSTLTFEVEEQSAETERKRGSHARRYYNSVSSTTEHHPALASVGEGDEGVFELEDLV